MSQPLELARFYVIGLFFVFSKSLCLMGDSTNTIKTIKSFIEKYTPPVFPKNCQLQTLRL